MRHYNSNKLLSDAYKCNLEMMTTYNLNSIWLQNVKESFAVSVADIWANGGDECGDFPSVLIDNLLKDRFLLQWQKTHTSQSLPEKTITYIPMQNLSPNNELEKYLIVLKDMNVTQLRISAHNLVIEMGRYKRPKQIPISDRLCDKCAMVDDEFNLILNRRGHNREQQHQLE